MLISFQLCSGYGPCISEGEYKGDGLCHYPQTGFCPKICHILDLGCWNSSHHLTVFPKLSYLLLCFPSLVPPVPLQTVNASREWQSLWCQIWISAGWVRMLCWMQYRTCSEVRWDQDNGLNERKLTCTKSLFQTPQDFMFQSAFLWWPPFIHSHYISPAPWSAFCVNDHDLYASHTSEKHKLSRLNCPFTRRPNFSLGW